MFVGKGQGKGCMRNEGIVREEGEHRPLATSTKRKERSQGQRTILSSRHSM